MKLLFDANLSPSLPQRLMDLYPGSIHVGTLGLTSSDAEIWSYCRENGLVVVSKDSDFQQLSLVFGSPPKAILIRLGNCRTSTVESLLRSQFSQVAEFYEDKEATFMVLPL